MRRLALVTFVLTSCGTSTTSAPGDAATDAPEGGATGKASGGAQIVFRDTAARSCPNAGESHLAAARTADGRLRMVANGENGAVVRCAKSATAFDASVSIDDVGVTLTGTISGSESTDAQVTVALPSRTYRATATRCTINVQANTAGELRGTLDCPSLALEGGAGECSTIGGDPSVGSYFAFGGCAPL
ncbi:MAG: hypothetical protein HYV09_41155 [Deltaproteobacteria bacterium]|nr:hypothetical protein [Deltaproteobacteria bacterium]